MLPFPNMLNLFMDKLACSGGRRLPFLKVSLSASDGFLFRHRASSFEREMRSLRGAMSLVIFHNEFSIRSNRFSINATIDRSKFSFIKAEWRFLSPCGAIAATFAIDIFKLCGCDEFEQPRHDDGSDSFNCGHWK
jgi:hypothetical protein